MPLLPLWAFVACYSELYFCVLYISHFGAIISQSSGSWNKNSFEIHNDKIGHDKHAYVYVVVSIAPS